MAKKACKGMMKLKEVMMENMEKPKKKNTAWSSQNKTVKKKK